MRMIDADALWEIFREKQNSLTARCGGYRFLDDEDRAEYDRLEITLAYIENAPEVDAVPVVRGEWEEMRNPYGELEGWIHKKCGRTTKEASNYCPNCGAKMESEGST
jgi:hypothetical protein